MGRGNHDSCDRGGHGSFLLLDPRKYPANTRAGDYCIDFQEPYKVPFEKEQFIVIDNNQAGGYQYSDEDPENAACPAPPNDGSTIVPFVQNRYNERDVDREELDRLITRYERYWQQTASMAESHETNFLVTHRPILAVICFFKIRNLYVGLDWHMTHSMPRGALDRVNGIISGHVHLAQALEFVYDQLPAQLVVGHGGTKLSHNGAHSDIWPHVHVVTGRENENVGRVQRGFINNEEHGFALMERSESGDYHTAFRGVDKKTREMSDIGFPVSTASGIRVSSARVGEPSKLRGGIATAS